MLERVQKIISAAGVCSRRRAEELIEMGLVTINKKQAILGDKADADIDDIRVEGKRLSKSKKQYVLLHKPRYFETTLAQNTGKRTIIEMLKKYKERLYPVGRLDYNAEGMLLLTNDGDFANAIMHPRYTIDKTYVATLDRAISQREINSLKNGIRLKDGPVKDIAATIVSPDKTQVKLTIHEGRNKVVKRIFKELGYYVIRLKRIQIGNLTLGNLKVGHTRSLSKNEVESLLDMALSKNKRNKQH